MGLVFITGISSSGKSAVLDEIRRRGFEAHDADNDGFCQLYDRSTNEFVVSGHDQVWASEWRHTHDWSMIPERVERLAAQARDSLVFLGGAPANEYDFYHLYSCCFSLQIDEATLRHRLLTRTSSQFGKEAWQLDWVLEVHKRKDTEDLDHGCVPVDATLPLSEVVDLIVQEATARERTP